LTENRLIERRDKTKSVETQGNGFVLSPKGLAVLQLYPSHVKSPNSTARRISNSLSHPTSELPTERQLAYAQDLGISVPADATKDEVGDLIDARLKKDKPAAPHFQAFARRLGVAVTRYTGKKSLFDRLYAFLIMPDREEDMAAWFVFRVYRELVRGAADVPILGLDDSLIREIANQIIQEDAVLKSLRRYQGRDLVWFGEWTSPNGTVHSGGSNNTIAYKRASSLLREKGVA
jgi:hypothetical protein